MPPKENDVADQSTYSTILEQDRFGALLDAISSCRNEQELRAYLTDLCTPQELQILGERWTIARLLAQEPLKETEKKRNKEDKQATKGLSYRDISALTGASTTTVGRVARFLQQEPHQGYQMILDRLAKKDIASTKK